MIRILIADDHPIVRSGIRSELADLPQEFEMVAEAINGDEALRLARCLEPDFILLDVNMPGTKAAKVLAEVKQECPSSRVIILTAYGDAGTALGLLKAGADGYVLKDEDPAMIVEAIRAVKQGKKWVSLAVDDQLRMIEETEPGSATGCALTAREQEILSLLAAGLSNKEIAQSLHIAKRTVEYHVTHVLEKLGVENRLEAVLRAKEHGVV